MSILCLLEEVHLHLSSFFTPFVYCPFLHSVPQYPIKYQATSVDEYEFRAKIEGTQILHIDQVPYKELKHIQGICFCQIASQHIILTCQYFGMKRKKITDSEQKHCASWSNSLTRTLKMFKC